jgi:DNA end-binding protein Ku
LAKKLIGSLAASFEPEKYHDTYREQLEALIQAKVQGKAPAERAPRAEKSRVVDITEALQKSLAALKKPPAAEKHPVAKTKKAGARAGKGG